MVGIVEHLILRRRLPYRQVFLLTVHVGRHLLCQIEHTRVAHLRNLIFELQLEILELVGKDKVATVHATAFAVARTLEMNGSILNVPVAAGLVLAVATPSVEGLSVEESDKAILIYRIFTYVDVSLVGHLVGSICSRRVGLLFACAVGTAAVTVALVLPAGGKEQRCARCEEKCMFHASCLFLYYLSSFTLMRSEE